MVGVGVGDLWLTKHLIGNLTMAINIGLGAFDYLFFESEISNKFELFVVFQALLYVLLLVNTH